MLPRLSSNSPKSTLSIEITGMNYHYLYIFIYMYVCIGTGVGPKCRGQRTNKKLDLVLSFQHVDPGAQT